MGRRKRTEVRRDEIARAVLELVAAEGYEAVSMVAVSKRIGVVPSALYRHFPSKDDMVIAAMKLHRDDRLRDLNSLLAQHEHVLPAYEAMINQIPCFVGQTAAMPRLTFGILPKAGAKLREEARNLFDGFIDKMTVDFERAKLSGEIDEEVNCRTAAMAVWGLLVTAVVRHNLYGEDFDAASHVHHGWVLFMRAVRHGAPGSPPGERNTTPVAEVQK